MGIPCLIKIIFLLDKHTIVCIIGVCEEIDMSIPKTTPRPWRAVWWKNEDCVDGVEMAITDSNGHGLFVACQKGKSEKVQVNAQCLLKSVNNHENLTKALQAIIAVSDISCTDGPVPAKEVRERLADVCNRATFALSAFG